MGFTIFTTSGTFNPSSYGLVPNDMIHVKVVGGGGSGCNMSGVGTAGGTSSFGSILSAAGGYAGSGSFQNQDYSNPGGGGFSCQINSSYYVQVAGNGGDGWIPGGIGGAGTNMSKAAVFYPYLSASGSSYSGSYYNYHYIPSGLFMLSDGLRVAPQAYSSGSIAAQYSPMTGQRGGYGGIYLDGGGNYVYVAGAGGLGYGAGGGAVGVSEYFGGNSGQIRDVDYILPNLNSIAITVGAGGSGYYSGSYATYYSSGGGCNGCVVIWW